MTRLIDADKLALYLNDYALTEEPDERESAGERRISNEIYNTIQNCMKAVDEQPTAYDVDKVVEQLETRKTKAAALQKKYTLEYFEGKADAFECAIKIVKGGGVE